MAHIKNIDFNLYTGFVANGNDCYAAYEHFKNINFPVRHLHYGDPAQHEEVLKSVNSWFENDETVGIINFPFVTYEKLYDQTDLQSRSVKIVVGVEAIKNTNWQELLDFQG